MPPDAPKKGGIDMKSADVIRSKPIREKSTYVPDGNLRNWTYNGLKKGSTTMKKVLAVTLAAALTGTFAYADTFGFECVTNNLPGNGDIGEAQLFVDVTASGGIATFVFTNTGPETCVITDVYFYDGVLFDTSYLSLEGSAGVEFEEGAKPSFLPGDWNRDPTLTVFASAGSSPMADGVDPGESLTIQIGLLAGITEADILAALNNRTFLIGVKVQGFDNEGSEAFITLPNTTPVPEPCTLALMGLGGLLALGVPALRRRQR